MYKCVSSSIHLEIRADKCWDVRKTVWSIRPTENSSQAALNLFRPVKDESAMLSFAMLVSLASLAFTAGVVAAPNAPRQNSLPPPFNGTHIGEGELQTTIFSNGIFWTCTTKLLPFSLASELVHPRTALTNWSLLSLLSYSIPSRETHSPLAL